MQGGLALQHRLSIPRESDLLSGPPHPATLILVPARIPTGTITESLWLCMYSRCLQLHGEKNCLGFFNLEQMYELFLSRLYRMRCSLDLR